MAVRLEWRQALRVLCASSLWLASATHAFAEFDLSSLWTTNDHSDTDEETRKSAPLDWLSGGYQPEQALYFGGVDMQRYGFAAYTGTVWSRSPGMDGLLLRLFASDGIDSYRTPTTTTYSQTLRAALTPGYRISRRGFELSAYAGFEVLGRMALPITKTTRLQPNFGMRLSTDIWWEPVNAVMIAANISMTTIEASFYGRLATGIRIMDVWAGPEISASSDIYSQQYRIGAHLTGMRAANYEMSAAIGYAFDSFGRGSTYGRFGITLHERDRMTILP